MEKQCKIAEIDELLSKLNDEQIKPVLDTEGAVLVIAGAGSGKTRVLTSRIAYLVLEKNVQPFNILAITFTNKAANEMKERLYGFIGESVNEMWVSTIHSMCVRILRKDIEKIGYDKNFTIYDDTDKEKILKRILDEAGYDKDKFLKPAKNYIATAKNNGLTPDACEKQDEFWKNKEELNKIYSAYENELVRSNALDFDDLLLKTYELLTEKPEVADYYSQKFQYIHIDEFQDTNKVQFEIARRLSLSNRNIFVVGDDDQSIYGWRGAKIENILNFDEIYSNAKVYKLEQNYRSTKKILDLANCIISHNTSRRKKVLWTNNEDGVKVETFVGNDENNEAAYVAMQIKNLMDRNPDYNYSDFGVFMRLNALSRAFEQEFMKYGIPCKIFGGFRFFERKEIKDLLAYLKIINNPKDDESFMRCIASPKRGIGEKTLNELKEFSVAHELSMFEALSDLNLTAISAKAKTKLKNFGDLLKSFKDFSENNTIVDTIDKIIESTDFTAQFDDEEEDNDKLLNIGELKNSAEQFMKDNKGATLSEYLNSVTLSSDTDDINDGNAVVLATIHSVKGLEFPCVFIAGLDEKIMPIQRSGEDETEMEEERRLMYVAVTRAKERLYLTRAMSRYMYGNRDFMIPSRFLRESASVLGLPQEKKNAYKEEENANYYDGLGKEYNGNVGYSSNYAKSMLEQNKPKANENVDFCKFKSGVKVKHAKFGEGTVIAVKGEKENIIVDVAFLGIGIKSLAAKYAPMEII